MCKTSFFPSLTCLLNTELSLQGVDGVDYIGTLSFVQYYNGFGSQAAMCDGSSSTALPCAASTWSLLISSTFHSFFAFIVCVASIHERRHLWSPSCGQCACTLSWKPAENSLYICDSDADIALYCLLGSSVPKTIFYHLILLRISYTTSLCTAPHTMRFSFRLLSHCFHWSSYFRGRAHRPNHICFLFHVSFLFYELFWGPLFPANSSLMYWWAHITFRSVNVQPERMFCQLLVIPTKLLIEQKSPENFLTTEADTVSQMLLIFVSHMQSASATQIFAEKQEKSLTYLFGLFQW